MQTETTKKLFTVDEYDSMFDAGILDREARVELIEGEIFLMAGPGPLHVACVNRATSAMVPALVGKAIVSVSLILCYLSRATISTPPSALQRRIHSWLSK
jgi:hypothetical protein